MPGLPSLKQVVYRAKQTYKGRKVPRYEYLKHEVGLKVPI